MDAQVAVDTGRHGELEKPSEKLSSGSPAGKSLNVKRWGLRLAVVLVLIFFGGMILVYGLLRGSQGVLSGERTVSGLSQSASIQFDEVGRPLVKAASLGDALVAQGYLHGSERLWQMELFRRAGQGRLAALMGKDLVEADIELWRMGVPQLAGQLYRHASATMRTWVEGYVQGINAAIRAQRVAPPEFLLLDAAVDPWRVEDVFAVGALIAFQSANNHQNELLRLALARHLGPAMMAPFLSDGSDRPDFPFVVPSGSDSAMEGNTAALAQSVLDPLDSPYYPRIRFGSNGWVVAPERSATGQALYAFDSHDTLGLPNLFYEVHLFYREGAQPRQIRGWSVPGLPGVINGFNEAIAWGFTNIGDTQDLFLETPCDGGSQPHFWYGEECREAEVMQHQIEVKGAEPVNFTITTTAHGPLIREEPALALSWTMHDFEALAGQGFGLEALLALNRARNWREFSEAIDRHAAPTLNATYADIHGDIGFRTAGLIPQRGAGEGLYPLEGRDPANDWQGWVPVAQMPRRLNPPEGFLAAANARVNPPGVGPLVSADNAAPYRIGRILQVLGESDRVTVAQMQALQRDWYDGQAALLLPRLIPMVERAGLDNLQLTVLDRLTSWMVAPFAEADSLPALVFQRWYLALAEAVFAEPLGDALYSKLLKRNYLVNDALDGLLLDEASPSWWPGGRAETVTQAFLTTLETLEAELGSLTQWRLDALQQVGLPHELGAAVPVLAPLFNASAVPWGGSPASVGRANYRYDAPFRVRQGATVRAVAQMTPVPQVASVIPGGQSGHPLSRHYQDQFPAWLAGELLPIPTRFDPERGTDLILSPEDGEREDAH